MLDPKSPAYNIGEYLDILGPVDPKLFETALRRVVAETDALHLRFIETDDGPRQYIRVDPDWVMPFIDVSAVPDPRATAASWMHTDLARVVDLARGPLFGYSLFRIAQDRFFWYARCHHLCQDGLSGSLVAQRLAALYSAAAEGRPAGTEAPGSWLDLLNAEACYRRSARHHNDREYWRSRLEYRPKPVTLSGKPPKQVRRCRRCTRHLPRRAAEAIRAAGRARGASLPQIVTAIAALYLHRLTGIRDLILGVPVMARSGSRRRRIVGMVSNVLPLRLVIDPQESFDDLLGQAVRRLREMLRHHRYRAEDLRNDLGLQPDEQMYGTLVNVMSFDYDLRFAGGTAHAHNLSNGPVDELSIAVYDRRDGSDLRIDFDAPPAHYTSEELAAHQRRFLALLVKLATAVPDQPLSRLNVVSAKERQVLFKDFNATAQYVPEATLAELFEAQVARNPEAIAVVTPGEDLLSYGELNARANRLAHHLIGVGVGPECLVGIVLERSADLVAALLATLKAGAAFLPLEPHYPSGRLAFVLADAGPTQVLSTAALRPRLPQTTEVLTLDTERTQAALGQAPDHNPTDGERTCPLRFRHLAYVIYTSGSTGSPKGVAIDHRALNNKVCTLDDFLDVDEATRYAAMSSISFDPLLEQILCPLCAGGVSVIIADDVRRDARDFAAFAQRHGLTVLDSSPGLLEALLPAGQLPVRLDALLIGGDVLPARLAGRLLASGVTRRLFNLYGPTEACIDASAHEVSAADLVGSVPIGSPLPNYHLYVLDAGLEPVPVGVTGELCVAGVGLARGYLGRPRSTAERFVAHPHGTEPGDRIYRTGDLTRWRADGTLDFVGRADRQVKIRGIRIELGEIEAVLKAHDDVAEVAVIAGEDGPGGKELIAYLVASRGAKPDAAILRRNLEAQMPVHMVPTAYEVLEALPLLPSGKVDRHALPAPERPKQVYRSPPPLVGQRRVPPRTATERSIAEIWQELLDLERVWIDDDFLELGGNSLLTTRLLSRINARLDLELTFAELIGARTIERVAELVDAAGERGESHTRLGKKRQVSSPHVVVIQPNGTMPPFFCVHPGGGNVLRFRHLAKNLSTDQPFYAIQATGTEFENFRSATVEAMARKYLHEIRPLAAGRPFRLGGWSFGGLVAFEMALQLVAAGEEVEVLVLIDTPAPPTEDSARPEALDILLKEARDLSIPFDENYLRSLGFDDAIARLAEEVRDRGLLPAKLSEKERQRLLPMFLSKVVALARYTPKQIFADRLDLLRARDVAGQESHATFDEDPTYGWNNYVSGYTHVELVSGNHLTLMKPPFILDLAEKLRSLFDSRQSARGPKEVR